MMRSALERVAVVGTSCSGKTAFARRLSRALGVRHIELDALHWGPDWTEKPADEFRPPVEEAVSGPRLIIDGNYSRVPDLVWGRARTIIWLNYSFPVIFARALRRTIRRSLTREELWAGNRESLVRGLLTADGIPWWVIRTYRRRRRDCAALRRREEFAHLDWVEFRRPGEAEAFLGGIEDGDDRCPTAPDALV
jgi:adenylate kinase family enzyme